MMFAAKMCLGIFIIAGVVLVCTVMIAQAYTKIDDDDIEGV